MCNVLRALRASRKLVRELQARYETAAQRRQTVGYIGWAGNGNAGDDCILTAVKRLLPEVHWTEVNNRIFALTGLLGLNRPGHLASIALGGGTLIGRPRSFLRVVKSLRQHGHSLWAFGTGVGSCGWGGDRIPAIKRWKVPLAEFKGIGVRGPLSKSMLDGLGVPGVTVVGDLALSLARESPPPPPARPCLAVNLSVPLRADEVGAMDGAIRIITAIAEQRIREGWKIVLLAMDQADIRPLADLAKVLGISSQGIFYSVNADDIMGCLGECTCLIGVRLHSAVLACCAGVPPVLLGYREKCLDFMLSMGLEDRHVPLAAANKGSCYDLIESMSRAECMTTREKYAMLRRAHEWKGRQLRFAQGILDSYACNEVLGDRHA